MRRAKDRHEADGEKGAEDVRDDERNTDPLVPAELLAGLVDRRSKHVALAAHLDEVSEVLRIDVLELLHFVCDRLARVRDKAEGLVHVAQDPWQAVLVAWNQQAAASLFLRVAVVVVGRTKQRGGGVIRRLLVHDSRRAEVPPPERREHLFQRPPRPLARREDRGHQLLGIGPEEAQPGLSGTDERTVMDVQVKACVRSLTDGDEEVPDRSFILEDERPRLVQMVLVNRFRHFLHGTTASWAGG